MIHEENSLKETKNNDIDSLSKKIADDLVQEFIDCLNSDNLESSIKCALIHANHMITETRTKLWYCVKHELENYGK